ncbi:MAG: sugar ABC transporter permease [Chloroflexota bacterium]|nr:sugar ABC transporter permease [Chloroflexota bacterium]
MSSVSGAKATPSPSTAQIEAPVARGGERWLPYLLLLPALAILVSLIVPFVIGVYWSLTDYKLTSTLPKQFIGLRNYQTLLQDAAFWNSMRVTLTYCVIALLIELPLGLAVAVMLNRDHPVVRFFRAVMILPLMMPPVVGALMWKSMMTPDGILNYLLGMVGIGPLQWLGSVQLALPSILLIDIWLYTPFAALVLLAGLQALPKEPFEAARVDGASPWVAFRTLTLPMLLPFLIIVGAFRGIDSLKIFDLIYATTQGGPVDVTNTLAISTYFQAIRWTNFGTAMSYAIVLWLMCYILAFILIKRWRKAMQG